MPILPRGVADRRYFLVSGVWFLIATAAVSGVAVFGSTDTFSRVVGALLACGMLARAILQLRRARAITEQAGEPKSAVAGDHRA